MSNGFRLGNLSVTELEGKLGIKLSEEHRASIEESRVNKVSDSNSMNYKIAKNAWHAFEFPVVQIYAGSESKAHEIAGVLQGYMVDGAFQGETNKLLFLFDR